MNTTSMHNETPAKHDEAELHSRVTVVETRFDALFPVLAHKADLEEMRADLVEAMHSHFRWMIGIFITIIIGVSGIYYGMWTAMERTMAHNFSVLELVLHSRMSPAQLPSVPPEQKTPTQPP